MCATGNQDKLDRRPELFFGLVAPIGVGGGTLTDCLMTALREVGYTSKPIQIINLLRRRVAYLKEGRKGPLKDMERFRNEAERYDRFIRAGDHFCQLMGGIADHELSSKGQDALVALSVEAICEHRELFWDSSRELREKFLRESDRLRTLSIGKFPWQLTALDSHAYILRSLKRPGEIDRLRKIYGNGFFLISAYSPHSTRIDNLSTKIASSDFKFNPDEARFEAERLLKIDQEEEGKPFGQNVRKTFAKADYFVDARQTPELILKQLRRFVRLLFGYQFYTPSKDEQGMALAYLASLRSSHISRQVGAAITSPSGSVVALGCNEVPRAGGGSYWDGDEDDARDFQQKKNTSLEVRREVVGDILQRLCDMGWLAPDKAKEFREQGDDFLDDAVQHDILKEAKAMDAIEYDRSVHAEMTALSDAVRRGVAVDNCTLYTTTFPCHNCARHIVAAGIRRVVYQYPYEKSLTQRLHGDSIGIDLSPETGKTKVRFDPFVGVSPNLYPVLFTIRNRKGDGKRWRRFAKWKPDIANPIVRGEPLLYADGEEAAIEWLMQQIKNRRLVYSRRSE